MEKKSQLIPELNHAAVPIETPKPPKRKGRGCLTAVLICLGICAVSLLLMYVYIRSQLPDVGDLRSKASQFETMRIMDRQGNLLYEVVPSDTGRRDYVGLDEISSYVLASVIAVEDQDYYSHPGFDLSAIIRAVFQNSEAGETVSGASTITQQLARGLLLSPDERSERSLLRKIREVLLAVEITPAIRRMRSSRFISMKTITAITLTGSRPRRRHISSVRRRTLTSDRRLSLPG